MMGHRIEIEKRLVISLPNLFGEIGGLNDFFATLVIILINGYQAKNFLLDSIGRFFLIKLSTNKGQSVNTSNLKSLFTDFKLSCCNKVKIWFLCKTCLTKRERKLKTVMKKAEEKLESALNMQSIIHNQRALKTLFTLLLSRPSRKLLYF